MALVFNNANVEHGKSHTFTFNQRVTNVTVGIQGYSVKYPNSDNHVRAIDVNANIASISGQQVTVTANCVMYDDSKNYAYGSVDITCIAVV
ncbi:hypothetical protein [Paenibacillus sp. ISL-20]|uniref:hypothetical protein n=1 Tax=Paenibacillus sp. ISL-20 TaxID=2819163 RepID=UPI001BE5CF7E|nr:hypothetical protein [Paenibacillus sp. ISL-20]MBT2765563.1 hypothetical protein [Paenibacillus sp. ISL-20]